MHQRHSILRGLAVAAAICLLFACENPSGASPDDNGGDNQNLSAPTVSATAVSSASITISWSSVSEATGYTIYRSDSATGPFTVRASNQQGNEYTDSALTASTTYFYKVSAVADEEEGVLSDLVSATTQATPTTPTIGLSPANLSFSATVGASSPSAKTVSVSNIGTGSLRGLSVSVHYSNGSGWLTASLSSSSAPSTLTVRPQINALAAGTYSASVRISSSITGVVNKSIGVSLTVSAPTAYTLTTTVNPSGSGSVTRNPNYSSYASGTGVTVTANPGSGYIFSSWSGAATGSTNPITVTMNSNKTLTANFTAASVGPTISAPSSASSSFQVNLSYAWPSSHATTDRYELEASYYQSSGYSLVVAGANGVRTSPIPFYLTPDASDIGKTIYLRARVRSNGSYSPYSQVKTVTVPNLKMYLVADADNTVIYNSANTAPQNTVYPNGDISVGTNYFYNAFSYEYLNGAAAIRFSDLTTYIYGKTITKATLIFQVNSLPGAFDGSYAVNALAGSWSPSTLTYNNCPDYYTSNTATKNAPTSSAVPWSFDVTGIVRAWAAGTWTNNGFYLRDANISAPGSECYRGIDLLSVESGVDFAPRLYLEVN